MKFYKVENWSVQEVYGQDIVDGKVQVDWQETVIAYAESAEEALNLADAYDSEEIQPTNQQYGSNVITALIA